MNYRCSSLMVQGMVCFRLIDICDEVWIYGNSEGCRKEKMYALLKGKKVIDKRGD